MLLVLLEGYCVIEVLTVGRVNGKDIHIGQVHTFGKLRNRDAAFRDFLRFQQSSFIKLGACVIVCKHCLTANLRKLRAAKGVDHRNLVCKVAVAAVGNLHQHLVAILCTMKLSLFNFQQKACQAVRAQIISIRLTDNHSGKWYIILL